MSITLHHHERAKIAEVISDEVVVKTAEDGLDLLGNAYYQGADKVIICREHISADFFDLKTGMAGELLQKFSNYGVKLAIVGDFTKDTSRSLQDFIRESNRQGHITFVTTVTDALETKI